MTKPEESMPRISPEKLAELLDRHAAALRLYAAQWSRSADDCVQESFIELASQSPVPDDMLSWLYRVVRNKALNAARGDRRRRRHEAEAVGAQQRWFIAASESAFDAGEVERVLESLAPEQREVILARLWGGLTLEQIAHAMGTSTSSVHRCYHAALKIMRTRLESPCANKTNPSTS
jgi:RNA polymerase sigma-70 factor (ECF subfamily)